MSSTIPRGLSPREQLYHRHCTNTFENAMINNWARERARGAKALHRRTALRGGTELSGGGTYHPHVATRRGRPVEVRRDLGLGKLSKLFPVPSDDDDDDVFICSCRNKIGAPTGVCT
jgi:hypothetical protein